MNNNGDTKVYGKILNDIKKLGIDEPNKYVKLIEDFSEISKRIACVFEAVTSRFALETAIVILDSSKDPFTDSLKNINWIYLSYSCTELTNIFHGESNGFPAIYKKLYNSMKENKFPAYLGVSIDRTDIEDNEKLYIDVSDTHSADISKIKACRDKTFSHIDKNQDIKLPSTQIMLRMINKVNNVFVDLYRILGFTAVNKNYTKKKNPEPFTAEDLLSKITFFLGFCLRERQGKEIIIETVIEKLSSQIKGLLT